MGTALLVVTLLYAICHVSVAQINFNTQILNSGFITPSCNRFSNQYDFGFVNSMNAGSMVDVVLSCSGAPPVSRTFFAPAKRPLFDLFITPQAPYSVSNTPCELSVSIEALNTTDPTDTLQLGAYRDTCGPIPSNQFDQFVPGCSYIDLSCNVQNGHALRYGPFMIIMMTSVSLILYASGIAIAVTSERAKIRNEYKKHDFVANGNVIRMIYENSRNQVVQPGTLAGGRMIGGSFNSGVSSKKTSSSSKVRRHLLDT